jgi:hypothetical protein
MKDDRLNKCKSCVCAYVRRRKKSEAGKFSDKKYNQSDKGKAALKRYQQSEKGKVVCRKANKKYRQSKKGKAANRREGFRKRRKYPEKVKAIKAVSHAIEASKLPRANTLLCHYCSKPAQQYHHWHGYEPDHWLDVVPVCIKCHNSIHQDKT